MTKSFQDLQTAAKNPVDAANELLSKISVHSDQISTVSNATMNQMKYKTVSVTIGGPASPILSNYDAIFQRLAYQGAGCVLVTLHGIADGTSTGTTFVHPTQTDIQNVINLAVKYNVPIYMMKPHVVTIANYGQAGAYYNDGFGRGNYFPTDPAASFVNWEAELRYIAAIAVANNIPYLSLTCEQPNQTDQQYYSTWQGITQRLRQSFPSLKLTAAFTYWEGTLNLGFFKNSQLCLPNLLDAYGHNMYPFMTYIPYAVVNGFPNFTYKDAAKAYYYDMLGNNHMGLLDNVRNAFGLDLFITETGIIPKVDAIVTPTSATGATSYDVQAIHLRSFFEVVCRRRDIIGFSIWHVSNPFTYYDTTGATILPGEQAILDYIKGGKL